MPVPLPPGLESLEFVVQMRKDRRCPLAVIAAKNQ
jgi:hypothetical protein